MHSLSLVLHNRTLHYIASAVHVNYTAASDAPTSSTFYATNATTSLMFISRTLSVSPQHAEFVIVPGPSERLQVERVVPTRKSRLCCSLDVISSVCDVAQLGFRSSPCFSVVGDALSTLIMYDSYVKQVVDLECRSCP